MTQQAQTVSLDRIAVLFGVTTETIRTWRKDGMPHRLIGERPVFVVREAIRWRRDKDRAQWVAKHPRAPGDVEEARFRKLSAEAELIEMERDVQRGRLIDVGLYERGLMLAFGRVRERLVALAPRVAPHLLRLESEAAAEAVVDRYVLEAIAELRADEVPDDEEPVAVAVAVAA